MRTIEDTLCELDPELRKLSLDIHGERDSTRTIVTEKRNKHALQTALSFNLRNGRYFFPFVGARKRTVLMMAARALRRYAHDRLTEFMSSRGFTVTRHYLDLATAWRAEFKHGVRGRTVGVNAEMDALPGIGHACGHNLIAMAGVGIALALRAALEKHDVPGTIVLLGTPGTCPSSDPLCAAPLLNAPALVAEESGAGKQILLDRGAYKDMDVCIMYVIQPAAPHHCSTCVAMTL